MVSDSKEFKFCFLNEQKKFFVSKSLPWAIDRTLIIDYIDMMLKHAIESSPRTTPHKRNTRSILTYADFMERQWKFGDEADDESGGGGAEESHGEESHVEDHDIVDVVVSGGRVVMRGSRLPGR